MAFNEITGSHLSTIPLFNGEESVGAVINFIASVDRAIQQFHWDPARAGIAAQNRLGEKAQTWLRGQNISEADERWGECGRRCGSPSCCSLTRPEQVDQEASYLARLLHLPLLLTQSKTSSRKKGRLLPDSSIVLALDRKNYIYTEQQKQAQAYRDALNHDLDTFFLGGLLPGIRRRVLWVANPPNNSDDSFDAARAAEAGE